MPPVFRELPPLELVERVLVAYSLRGFNDMTWFTKKTCCLSIIEDLLPELLPYYTPCKAEEDVTYASAFRILRHCIKAHGYELTYIEKSCRGKELWYQLVTPFTANTEVTFT